MERSIPISHPFAQVRSHYLAQEGDCIVLRGVIAPSIQLTVLALVMPIFGFWLDWRYHPSTGFPTSIHVIVLALSAFIALLGWWIRPRTVVIRPNSWLKLPGCTWEGKRLRELHVNDVATVQLCRSSSQQINLITKGSEACRVNLMWDPSSDRAAYIAKKIASLLDVPLQECSEIDNAEDDEIDEDIQP